MSDTWAIKVNLFFRVLNALAGICSIALSVALGWYAIDNASGHTALDPYIEILFLQMLAGFASLIAALYLRCLNPAIVATLTAVVGGALFTMFLDKTGSLREYNRWANSGLHPPPDLKNLYIGAYLFVLLLAIPFGYLKTKEKKILIRERTPDE